MIVAVAIAVPLVARRALDLEWSTESVRGLVESLGVWGPIAMVLIVAFRIPLLLNSQVVLTMAGACFGVAGGTLYGALGTWITGVMVFVLIRYLDDDRLARRVPPNLRRTLEVAGGRGAAAMMATGTALPFGPTSLYHAAAALTAMGPITFAIALAGGVIPRSFAYAAFGNELLEGDLGNAAWMGAAFLLPLALLAHPGVRAWLRTQFDPNPREEPPAGP
jgi:uncharacterized membrane protein YdjX (TVP38/TMEM64 family)